MEGEVRIVASTIEAQATLADRVRTGDSRAEDELVNTYWQGVFLIASVRTRDRDLAHDLAQEVLLAVLQALRKGQLRDSDKLAAFVQGTARNVINNYLSTRFRRAECELDSEELVAAVDPVETLEMSERQRLLRQELATFSMVDQKILLLSLVDGHSLAEVAHRLGMSHEAVRARKSRAVKKIMRKFARLSQK
jgi:RNA polymerase sigma factor (sigma-70 family)